MKKTVIVGATSTIAASLAREFAARGYPLLLAGRRRAQLDILADDLTVRGADQAAVLELDANDPDAPQRLLAEADARLGGVDICVIAHGTLSDQAACEQSVDKTLAEIQTNMLSQVALCTVLANHLEAQGSGHIVVLSSVAGDRGRQSNYVYGSAKAGMTAFTSGLRQRLHKSGVAVMTVKPGFVDSAMTAHIENKGALWAQPDAVAKSIMRGMNRGAPVVYTPWFWWGIMQIIKNIPERVFRRIRL
ncbi:MAG: short-chain dehydrogenase [Salinisphaeraceae bacterium]|nr:short-chain dehydrogenase [Salinisphaeraceae bacterium]